MPERPFALQEGETLLMESAENHFLRPKRSLVARLCRAYLTEKRLVLCEAFYDILKKAEKGVGRVIHDVALRDVADVHAESQAAEPSIEFDVRGPKGDEDKVLLFFRDKSWHLGTPERVEERDAWLLAIYQARRKLGVRPNRAKAPTPPMQGAELGLTIGEKYELQRKIGEGGMGLVFEGRDTSLDRPVAIKQMRPELQLLPRDKSSFLREAKTSASLHHPFIVDIYEILEVGGDLFLVFEFVDGQTVDQILDEKERMTPGEVKRALRCVCEALAFAHSRKIVHRDLKPSNIIVSRQGYAKVMDFGIARVVKDTTSRLTRADTSGTLAYMAPEQELGKSTLRSDIFSLGVTAYEMLSGEKGKVLETMTLPVGKGIGGWVAKNLKPEVVNDVQGDTHFAAEFDKASGFTTRSLLCVPMTARGELIGVIEVLNRRSGPYTQEHLELLSKLAAFAAAAIDNARSLSDQKNFFSHALELLTVATEATMPGMGGHLTRTAKLARALGRALGIEEYEARMLYYAGLLHDIGYIALNNQEFLRDLGITKVSEEQHPFLSTKMLDGIAMFEDALPVILHHHERYDGKGYPDMLSGPAIPLGSRILCLVENVEEIRMIGLRGAELYKKAVQEAQAGADKSFDPEVVKAFIALIESKTTAW
ncbi:MAG: protein kinase [Elusimicrobia bacterium]|nr:protein kinase [Elusimicrobiota bacterium]